MSGSQALPRIAVISFPGTNTERETLMAVRRAGMEPTEVLWNMPEEKIINFDGFIIAGGFSYEDRSRAGIIASLDPIMNTIKGEAEKGKPVLGICNGAQILVESGLVPGLENNQIGATLTNNKRTSGGHVLGTGYYNDWAHLLLTTMPGATAFTSRMGPGSVLYIPFAHAEGRFIFPEGLLDSLIQNGQIPFRYCNETGAVINEFPVNPNGSMYNTAAVTNPAGNVMAIMPHPERTTNGDVIFESMRDYIVSGVKSGKTVISFPVPERTIPPFNKKKGALELIIKMIITDNTAVSVHNALAHLDIPVSVSRYIHYEIEGNIPDRDEFLKNISETDVLFNSNKEHPVSLDTIDSEQHFLVRPREDLVGRQKLETLAQRFGYDNIVKISRGVLWNVSSGDPNFSSVLGHLLNTNILFNPFSHECYKY